MKTKGRFISANRGVNGLELTLAVDCSLNDIEAVKDKELSVELKYRAKRSLSANNYFWALCTEIANVLGTDKDTIYLMLLDQFGVFVDIEILRTALNDLKNKFRYVKEFNDGYNSEYTTARCYFGSSHYNTKEMATLIDGTVRTAHDLNITTWDEEEINSLIDSWQPLDERGKK